MPTFLLHVHLYEIGELCNHFIEDFLFMAKKILLFTTFLYSIRLGYVICKVIVSVRIFISP